jgi:thiol-disulfide isomerase/thioredoxin
MSQDYILEASIKQLDSKEVYLANFYGDKNSIVDTAVPDTSGYFSFQLKKELPAGMYRIFLSKEVFFDLIINKENISIESQLDFLYDSLKVIRSEENTLYYRFLKDMNLYQRKLELLWPLVNYYPNTDPFYPTLKEQYVNNQQNYIDFIDKLIAENKNSWTVKIITQRRPLYFPVELNEFDRRMFARDHFFDHVDFTDVDLVRSNVYTTLAIEYMSLYSNPNLNQAQLEDEFIKAVDKIMIETMDNSLIYEFIVEYLVGGFEKFHFEKVLDYIAENYSPEQCENEERKSDLQTRLKKYAELSVGKQAPEINAPDVNGENIKLSRISAEYTLVVFWASWCPHCNEMLPKVHNIYKHSVSPYKLQVLTVSLDKEKGEWLAALEAENYSWINTSDFEGWNGKATIDYNIYATPTMFLLDKDKKIVAKPITYNELEKALMKENIIK